MTPNEIILAIHDLRPEQKAEVAAKAAAMFSIEVDSELVCVQAGNTTLLAAVGPVGRECLVNFYEAVSEEQGGVDRKYDVPALPPAKASPRGRSRRWR